MKKTLSITIGISAYNEEANIQVLLQSIQQQKNNGFTIDEIIVVSDASSDKTAQKVREVKDSRIVFIQEKQRAGQNVRQNYILRKAKGDIVVFLEADTIFKNNNYIYELIKPFITNKNISMSYGTSLPIPLTRGSFFEKMLTFIETMKEKKFNTLKQDNLYLCGTGKAFSKEIKKIFFWPENVPEDTYAYLFCRQNKLKMSFRPLAVLHYKSPSNFSDYLKKTTRFSKGKNMLKDFFPDTQLEEKYAFSVSWILSFILEGFRRAPLYMMAYLFMVLVKKVSILFAPEFSSLWEVSSSTKILKTS